MSKFTPLKWGNEMEIPSRKAYDAINNGTHKIHDYGSSHGDGARNFEIKCKVQTTLAGSARFTDAILQAVVKYKSAIHSYPTFWSKRVSNFKAKPPKTACSDCKSKKRNKMRKCGCEISWTTTPSNCHDRDFHTEYISLCETNDCYWIQQQRYSYRGEDAIRVMPPSDSSKLLKSKTDKFPSFSNSVNRGLFKLEDGKFASSCATSSNHLHFSPQPTYDDYRRIFWLTRLYQQFFCNSPYRIETGDIVLSLRRTYYNYNSSTASMEIGRFGRASYGNGWMLSANEYNRGNNRINNMLVRNSLGTLEFRYNDLSKSPQTVLLFGYLATIGPYLPFETLPKRIGYKDTVYQFNRFAPTMLSFSKAIEDCIGIDVTFWNVYEKEYQTWMDLISSMFLIEMDAFEKFEKIQDWTERWAIFLGTEIPDDVIKGTIKDSSEVGDHPAFSSDIYSSLMALGGKKKKKNHWDKVRAYNKRIEHEGRI